MSAAEASACDCWKLIYFHARHIGHSNCNLYSVVNTVCTAWSNDAVTDSCAVHPVHCWTLDIMLWMQKSDLCIQRECIIPRYSMLNLLKSWRFCLLFLLAVTMFLMLSHYQLSSYQWLNLKLNCRKKTEINYTPIMTANCINDYSGRIQSIEFRW